MNETVEKSGSTDAAAAERANPYLARIFQEHLVRDPNGRAWELDGSALFADISGFTQLSEQLARKGREGAEQITGIIGRIFETMLRVAYENGGSLIKFGGDALLIWFDGDGHAARACRTAFLMRGVLGEMGRIQLPEMTVVLRMTQGVHSGRFHFFAAGTSHLEVLVTGPAWTRLVAIQHGAGADEIVMSAETAAQVAPECAGPAKGPGVLLEREPPGEFEAMPLRPRPPIPLDTLTHCLPRAIRAHVLAGGGQPEHRPVTIAFIRYEGTDALLEQKGVAATAEALNQLLTIVETAADAQDVAFLASDVDADGGKLILAAGAPKVTGDDEERMLLALRRIVEQDLPLPIRVGAHRGAVFAGDIGPKYRRTYTVMGDNVNLTARLMARAERGEIYATADVLDRSKTHFEATKLEPFAVKGKAEPVQAWSVGRAQSSKARQVSTQRLPLTGRNVELGVIRKAFASARSGAGRLIEIVGDSGIGKTRLLEALRDAAAGLNKQHAVCEAYTASTPYAVWIELLREYMKFGRDDPETVIAERLRKKVAEEAPDLVPWMPLIAIVFGLDLEPTPAVSMLAEKNRRAKVHESVARFLAAVMPQPQLIEIDNAHHMDEASAELLSYLTGEIGTHPWLFAVARQGSRGFAAPEAQTVVRIELKPLAPPDALRLAQLATQQTPVAAHVLEVVATRSGGNPQFLRDLLQKVVDSGGGVADLPDSAEAATMAQIDSLTPEERSVVRHAAVFGLTFHPRMLDWFDGEEGFAAPAPNVWSRIADLFDEEPDGYMRFRRSLLRDAAYEGLPYKVRRRLHGIVAAKLQEEMDHPEEAAGILSLHYFEAGEFRPAWDFATVAARRAEGDYAYVEAAKLYSRALDAAHRLGDTADRDIAAIQEAMGNAWHRAGEFQKGLEAYTIARKLVAGDVLAESRVLFHLSHLEGKLGNFKEAIRSAQESHRLAKGLTEPAAMRQAALSSAKNAKFLNVEGQTAEALVAAEQAVAEAETADDPDALGEAYFVLGDLYGSLGRVGARALMQRSLDAYQRSGNLEMQAALLSDLGAVCHWEGSWDEALSYWEQGRDAALKIGSTASAALARINVSDILIDRGEWAQAEAFLLETLPFWKASQFRFFLAACLSLLGRVSLRLKRFEEALNRLEEAKTIFAQLGAENEVPPVDARIAECHVAMGKPDAAVELVSAMLGRVTEENGTGRLVPLLERIKGHALLLQNDLWGARDALDASLAAATEKNNRFDAALTMLSLIELDRLEGIEPAIEIVNESSTILSGYKVRAVPQVPLPAQ